MTDLSANTKVTIELLSADNVQLGMATDKLGALTGVPNLTRSYELKNKGQQVVSKLRLLYVWMAKTSIKKRPAAKNAVAIPNERFSRPRLLQVGFYYDSTAKAMGYTKKLPILAPLVTFGESSLNYVLGKLNISSLASTHEIHNSLVPILGKIDASVDDKLAWGVDQLVKGQTYLLETKDGAVKRVGQVVNTATTSIGHVKEIGVQNFIYVRKVSMETANAVVSGTLKTVRQAKDNTLSTVSSASTSTYQTVSGAAVYLWSYVPIVGKKVMT